MFYKKKNVCALLLVINIKTVLVVELVSLQALLERTRIYTFCSLVYIYVHIKLT